MKDEYEESIPYLESVLKLAKDSEDIYNCRKLLGEIYYAIV